MFENSESRAIVERVAHQDASTVFIAEVEDSRRPVARVSFSGSPDRQAPANVTRTAFNASAPPPPEPELPPALNQQPGFMDSNMPATRDVPFFAGGMAPEYRQPAPPERWVNPAQTAYETQTFQPENQQLSSTPPTPYETNYQPGPYSGNTWNSSWGNQEAGSQFNPAPAPAAPAPAAASTGKPWRAGYGGVAPAFFAGTTKPVNDAFGKSNWQVPAAPSTNTWETGSPLQAPSAPGGSRIQESPQLPAAAPGGSWMPERLQQPASVPGGSWIQEESDGSAAVLDRARWHNSRRHDSPWSAAAPQQVAFHPGDTTEHGLQDAEEFFPGHPGSNRQQSTGKGNAERTDEITIRAEALSAFNQDRTTLSESTFIDAVSKLATLGKDKEVSRELIMRDWLNHRASVHPLTFMRGTAVLAAGLGQFRLEEGSRIDPTSHQDSKPRILKGYDYDFGGEATTWLRMAAGSLFEAQTYVRGHKGQVIEGRPMDDVYLQELQKLQRGVEKELNTIYGAHDLEHIYSTIRAGVRTHAGDWQHRLVEMQHRLDDLRTNDKRFIGKSARDLALGYLAEADYMASQDNNEDAAIMYRDANKYLNLSIAADPGAPDNQALQTISERLRSTISEQEGSSQTGFWASF